MERSLISDFIVMFPLMNMGPNTRGGYSFLPPKFAPVSAPNRPAEVVNINEIFSGECILRVMVKN